jgi:hypothetical protein
LWVERDLAFRRISVFHPGKKRTRGALCVAPAVQRRDEAPRLGPEVVEGPVVVLKTPHNFNYRSFEQKIDAHVVSVTRVKYRKRNYRGKRALFNLLEIRKTACREA